MTCRGDLSKAQVVMTIAKIMLDFVLEMLESATAEDIRREAHSPNGEFRKCNTLSLGCLPAAGVSTPLIF